MFSVLSVVKDKKILEFPAFDSSQITEIHIKVATFWAIINMGMVFAESFQKGSQIPKFRLTILFALLKFNFFNNKAIIENLL